MRELRLGLWAAVLFFLFLQLGQVQGDLTHYTLTDLSFGKGQGQAFAINDSGQIVGKSQDIHGVWHATLFIPKGNNIDLGTLNGGTGSGYYGMNINNSTVKVIVGDAYSVSSNQPRATIFDASGLGNNISLGTLGGTESFAYGINDAGQIVGKSMLPESNNEKPTLFNQTDPTLNKDLSSLDGITGVAYAINKTGMIVGEERRGTMGSSHATIFGENGNNIDMGTLPGGSISTALEINDGGQVVGWSDSSNGSRATIFDTSGHENNTDLGTLPGYLTSRALANNDKGQIVGTAMNSNGEFRATLFDPDGSPLNLNTLVDKWNDFSTDPKFTLTWATDINSRGDIVGYMDTPTGPHAFLLTPNPEPSSLLLMIGMAWSFLNSRKKGF